MTTGEAATQLCTCVFDCNVPLLRRFIKAGILVNAGNFDSRTALHVAAAEGNLAAVRLLCKAALVLPFEAPCNAMLHMWKLCEPHAGLNFHSWNPLVPLFCTGAGAGGGREG